MIKTETKFVTPVEPMLVGVKELAERLSVSPSNIRAMDNNGMLPQAIKLGKRKLWDLDELRGWKNARCPKRIEWMQIKKDK